MRVSCRWNTRKLLSWSSIAADMAIAYADTSTGVQQALRLTRQAWQQIKQLTVWRSTFYVQDFPGQRPMLSIKELGKSVSVYLLPLQYLYAAVPHWELALVGSNTRLTPWLKSGGCARALLSEPALQPPLT